MPEGTDLRARLAACDVDIADVDLLVLSHLHFDHAGGSGLAESAELVVQRAEWEAAMADVEGEEYTAADFVHAANLRLLDDGLDVFEDGRVQLIPSAGHTPGHQSLLLRTDDGGQLMLCGDACYMRQSLATLTPPPYGFSREAQLEVFGRFRQLEASGAQLLFGHDPDQWPARAEIDSVVELSHGLGTRSSR